MPVIYNDPQRGPPEALANEVRLAAQEGSLDSLVALFEEWRKQDGPSSFTPDNLECVLRWALEAENKSKITVAYILDQGSRFDNDTLSTTFYDPEPFLEIYELFIDHGWNMNETTVISSMTMLEVVIDKPQMVQWCLDHGADPNHKDRDGLTTLDFAAQLSPPEVIRLLVKHGADLSCSNALHSAVLADKEDEKDQAEQLKVIACLLDEFGMDINARATYGNRPPRGGMNMNGTPLHEAMQAGNLYSIKYLLERGADRTATDVIGQSAQAYAEEYASDEIKDLLRWPF